MRRIYNWRKATVSDVEADGLEDATLLHVLAYNMIGHTPSEIKGSDLEKLKKFFQWHIDNEVPIVGHYFKLYDIPLCERILKMDLSKLMVIDTVALSWYLNTDRKLHGLDHFFEEYEIKKPEVGGGEWVIPIRGLVVSTRKEKKVEYKVYKYLDHTKHQEPEDIKHYNKFGLDFDSIDLEQIASTESEKSYNNRLELHLQLMRHRCREDVKINKAMWEDFMERLIDMYSQAKRVIDNGTVGGTRLSEDEETYLDQFKNCTSVDEWINEILTFLMFKMDNIALKEKTRWKVDVFKLQELHNELEDKIVTAKAALEAAMPPIPEYRNMNLPKKPTKKAKGGGEELSASGVRWNDAVNNLGCKNDLGHELSKSVEGNNEIIKILKGYNDPNANSTEQIKSLLYSHGWKPETFEFVDDKPAIEEWEARGRRGKKPKPRSVPQISKVGEDGKELCPSVLKLAEKIPEIMHYQKYTTIKNRLDTCKGWIRDMDDEGYLKAGCGGFTNTLREMHRGLVNIPGIDKPYGKEMRGCLIAGGGGISLGSDLSSLEDRSKHHFMLPHDPEYVATMMSDDYDPHLLTALSARMITQAEYDGYKMNTLTAAIKDAVTKARKAGKQTNYACVYGASPPTVARSAEVPLSQAEDLVNGYWELNWSVKTIAEEQVVITCNKGKKWLVNPVNGFCYSLRAEKDRFSTLCQGTGSFFFDMWIDNILNGMESKFGVRRLNGLFHDEFIASFKDTEINRKDMEKITLDAIDKVNITYKLRRKLGCDVQFGDNYAQIH